MASVYAVDVASKLVQGESLNLRGRNGTGKSQCCDHVSSREEARGRNVRYLSDSGRNVCEGACTFQSWRCVGWTSQCTRFNRTLRTRFFVVPKSLAFHGRD